jgi:biopolymer transport protein ExbD
MVSTVFKKDEMALLLNLPKVEKGESQQKEQKTLMVELSSEKVAYNGKEISLDELEPKLKGISNKLIPIDLRVDKEVKYDRLVKLLNMLKQLELTNVSLITEK